VRQGRKPPPKTKGKRGLGVPMTWVGTEVPQGKQQTVFKALKLNLCSNSFTFCWRISIPSGLEGKEGSRTPSQTGILIEKFRENCPGFSQKRLGHLITTTKTYFKMFIFIHYKLISQSYRSTFLPSKPFSFLPPSAWVWILYGF
jgi:hypothetical protein